MVILIFSHHYLRAAVAEADPGQSSLLTVETRQQRFQPPVSVANVTNQGEPLNRFATNALSCVCFVVNLHW